MPWEGLAKRLEGRLVVLEPLVAAHESELYAAAQNPDVWRWMSYNAVESAERFHGWFDDALRATKAGEEAVFVVRSKQSGGVSDACSMRWRCCRLLWPSSANSIASIVSRTA